MPSRLVALAVCLLSPALVGAQGANAKVAPGSPTADNLPIYVVDPTWPPTLPNDWILGDIRGLFSDENDHLWIIHMPSSLTPQGITWSVPARGGWISVSIRRLNSEMVTTVVASPSFRSIMGRST